jgi:hypothetical protein
VDELGFEFVGCGDHLGRRAPFSFLTAAAAASDRLRLRTYVLNVGFWNPALLAREAATVDRVTDGRLELGLGAGTIRSEFEQAGLPWRPASERIVRMEQTVELVRHLLGDSSHEPQPVQRPIPILIGTMSMRGLTIAAEHADIVAFAAIRQAEGKPPGVLRSATARRPTNSSHMRGSAQTGGASKATSSCRSSSWGVIRSALRRRSSSARETRKILVSSRSRLVPCSRGRRLTRRPSSSVGVTSGALRALRPSGPPPTRWHRPGASLRSQLVTNPLAS